MANRVARRQGLCGGQVVPIVQSLIVSMYPKSHHGRRIAVIGSQAPVIGPFLGDWITEACRGGSIFPLVS